MSPGSEESVYDTVYMPPLRFREFCALRGVPELDAPPLDLLEPRMPEQSDPADDYLGEAWPHGKSLNIGAYGNTKEASKSGNAADFNVDGRVDWEDLTQFAAGWLDADAGIVNLDLTGIVDLQDMAIFADNWGWEE